MRSGPTTAERLRRVETALRQGLALLPEDADLFASAIHDVLEDRSDSLDARLGLKQHGGLSWRMVEAMQRRDVKLFEAARYLYRDKPATQAAAGLAKVIENYDARTWQRDRDNHHSAPKNLRFYEIFRETDGHVPTSPKQLQRILEEQGWLEEQGSTSEPPLECPTRCAKL